jgi:ParB family transcriptional regulator, chromosome partitioning protein
MPPKQSLGKGLGAIFPDLLSGAPEGKTYVTCGVEELSPNRFQPRKDFDAEELKSLADSIRKSGIIQPIVVRRAEAGGYEIITGERRWRAAQEAGLRDVPVIIREAKDLDIAEWSLIENIQRQDLNPIEEGEAYQTLIDKFGFAQEEIAAKVGKDRTTVTNTLRLLKLPPEAKTALVDKKISAGHARALLALGANKEQVLLLHKIVAQNLNVRQAEELAKKIKLPAPVSKKSKNDVVMTDLEKRLSSKLMTSVKISKNAKRGNIVIKFSSLDELNRLITSLLKV